MNPETPPIDGDPAPAGSPSCLHPRKSEIEVQVVLMVSPGLGPNFTGRPQGGNTSRDITERRPSYGPVNAFAPLGRAEVTNSVAVTRSLTRLVRLARPATQRFSMLF